MRPAGMHATATDMQLVLVHATFRGTEEHMLKYGIACQEKMNTVSVTLPCSQVGIHSADDFVRPHLCHPQPRSGPASTETVNPGGASLPHDQYACGATRVYWRMRSMRCYSGAEDFHGNYLPDGSGNAAIA